MFLFCLSLAILEKDRKLGIFETRIYPISNTAGLSQVNSMDVVLSPRSAVTYVLKFVILGGFGVKHKLPRSTFNVFFNPITRKMGMDQESLT